MKFRKPALVFLGIFALVLITGGIILCLRWPFSEQRITQSLQETFPATVKFHKFHSTYFPIPGCVGEGVTFTPLGSPPGTPPMVTMQSFRIHARYSDLFVLPGYLARIVLTGFRVQVPAPGTPPAKSNWKATPSNTRVGEIVADGALIEIARAGDHAALLFDIHTLRLTSVTHEKPMSYAVSLHNPLPPGEIRANGQFGPWNSADPGQTPLIGQSVFQDADLGVFRGIAGMLSSDEQFQGTLKRIEANGSIDVPDFMVTRSKHSVHLRSEFHGVVDGTNGDVELERVSTHFLKTHVLAKGKIAGHAGEHGKTAAVEFHVQDGRIQDLLRLSVRESVPPLTGPTSFVAHVIIPPGKGAFLEKVRLIGDFSVPSGQFTTASTQKEVDALSESARGVKRDAKAEEQDPERVISNLAGHVELRNAIATFRDFSFSVPGAFAQMHGTYNLESEVVNLHGTMKTVAELSEMNRGIKSVLLKPFDVFFKRKHAGAELPVHVIGTYHAPQAGLDLPVKKSAPKSASKASAANLHFLEPSMAIWVRRDPPNHYVD